MSLPVWNRVELDLLRSERARCRRCRSGHDVPCDGARAEYDEQASQFYRATKITYILCDYYWERKHRGARERAVRDTGLPPRWETQKCPTIPKALLSKLPCVVAPQQLTPEHTLNSSYLVQAAIMSLACSGMDSRYWFCPNLSFDHLTQMRTDLSRQRVLGLDRWDGGSHHEKVLGVMCGVLEQALGNGAQVIVGLLRPLTMLEPRSDLEIPIIAMLQDLPSIKA